MSSLDKGKEKEKEADSLPTLTDIERMALVAWQHQKRRSSMTRHIRLVQSSASLLTPSSSSSRNHSRAFKGSSSREGTSQQQKKKTNCGKHLA